MEIYSIVKKHIDAYDYDDLLAIGCPPDEYEYESGLISQRIGPESTICEIAAVIAEVLGDTMGSVVKADVHNPDDFLGAAAQIRRDIHADPPYSQ